MMRLKTVRASSSHHHRFAVHRAHRSTRRARVTTFVDRSIARGRSLFTTFPDLSCGRAHAFDVSEDSTKTHHARRVHESARFPRARRDRDRARAATPTRRRSLGTDHDAPSNKKHKTTRTSPRSRVYSRFADRSSAMLIADRARVPSTPSRTHHRRAWADSSRLTQGNGTVAAAAAPLGARWTRAIPPPRSRR